MLRYTGIMIAALPALAAAAVTADRAAQKEADRFNETINPMLTKAAHDERCKDMNVRHETRDDGVSEYCLPCQHECVRYSTMRDFFGNLKLLKDFPPKSFPFKADPVKRAKLFQKFWKNMPLDYLKTNGAFDAAIKIFHRTKHVPSEAQLKGEVAKPEPLKPKAFEASSTFTSALKGAQNLFGLRTKQTVKLFKNNVANNSWRGRIRPGEAVKPDLKFTDDMIFLGVHNLATSSKEAGPGDRVQLHGFKNKHLNGLKATVLECQDDEKNKVNRVIQISIDGGKRKFKQIIKFNKYIQNEDGIICFDGRNGWFSVSQEKLVHLVPQVFLTSQLIGSQFLGFKESHSTMNQLTPIKNKKEFQTTMFKSGDVTTMFKSGDVSLKFAAPVNPATQKDAKKIDVTINYSAYKSSDAGVKATSDKIKDILTISIYETSSIAVLKHAINAKIIETNKTDRLDLIRPDDQRLFIRFKGRNVQETYFDAHDDHVLTDVFKIAGSASNIFRLLPKDQYEEYAFHHTEVSQDA